MNVAVGSSTEELSSLNQLQRYHSRNFRSRANPKGEDISENDKNTCGSQTRDCLSDRCVAVVVSNFETYPVHENIPAGCMREITSRLMGDLDLKIASEFVFDENYWKQRCQQFPSRNYQINEHGLTWKQLFFETHLQQVRQFDMPP